MRLRKVAKNDYLSLEFHRQLHDTNNIHLHPKAEVESIDWKHILRLFLISRVLPLLLMLFWHEKSEKIDR